jgi:hypothetical protein
VPEISPPPLTPAQVTRLESLLKSGFRFVTFEQFARHLAVEKDGFVALLDVSGEKVRQFGSVGYRLGNGIAVLVDRPGGKAFVWKNESLQASPELLTCYARVKKQLDEQLTEGVTQ